MIGKDRIIELLKSLTREARKNGAGQAEALYVGSHGSTTRFANSVVAQNVKDSNRTIYFRILLDKRVGIASTNSLHIEDLRRCLKKAIAIAKQSKPLDFFDFLPEPSKYPDFKTHFPETANLTISDKIKMLDDIFKKLKSGTKSPLTLILSPKGRGKGEGVKAGGAFSTLETEVGIVNSNGVEAYQPFTSANINLITSSASASGFASGFERDIKKIDMDKLLATTLGKTIANKKLKKLKPGRYAVLLEPAAVNEILEWLVYIGFGAEAFIDGTSFMSGTMGKKIMDKKITIYDDGADTCGFPVPFDFEGVRKRRLDIIKNGVAKEVAYDTLLARRCRKKTTGHALIIEDIEGPFPSNVFIKEGNHSLDQMVSMVERGVIVTRFHYVNGLLDTKTASMTGMTRDGAFYIEDGKIKYPLEDMRFTESILEAFSRVEAISSEREAFPTPWSNVGANVVPALFIKEFNFSDQIERGY
ncbi:MAG: TldD/PmbA family protein [Deltaproteobacteria bacterium]|nr:TldD/PmbA family protein [Deltaproteobacteria bacterium]